MACEDVHDVYLYFGKSDFYITPLSVDVRKKQKDISKGKFELAVEDAEYIEQNAANKEPVFLTFDNYPAARFVLPADGGIEYTRRINEIDRAEMDLPDAVNVLKYGNVERSYEDTSLSQVVSDVLSDCDDPNNVITGIEYSSADPDEERDDLDFFAENFWSNEEETTAITDLPIGEQLQSLAVGFFEYLQENTRASFDETALFTGFDFKGITPMAAMNRIANEFGLTFRVDHRGKLIIGPLGSYGRVGHLGVGSRDFILSRYNVTQSSTSIDEVLVEGQYSFMGNRGGHVEGTGYDVRELQLFADVELEGYNGSSHRADAKGEVSSLQQLESAAVWFLMEQMRKDINGSFVINGAASENAGGLATLDVADWVVVNEDVANACDDDAIAGVFLVEEIQHKIDDTRGWRTTVEVAKTVDDPDAVNIESWIYDPGTNQRYESIQALAEATDSEGEGADDNTDDGFSPTQNPAP